ncbi:uncharacterized protein LOC133190738 [Saccostrea echinata]|uniref:uncharacterized protein LOC133190738 n=1 Tax=Saccostrea echinata TaxID=191078 RepID=UPI002A8271CB|nr:uncharacterized protein LOC133190738 [Saccostrea echinata]
MWDDVDANVVCRQMGFSSGTAIHLPRDYTYNRLLYNVNCFGHEFQLQSCQGEDYDMSGMCGYADDAGVSCSNMTNVQSSVTLGPGGRVLAHTSNGTGTVCSDQWDDMDADVVCRQMGYPSGTASFHPRDYMYNHVIFNVRCQGNESHVEQCPVDHSDMFGNCAYHGDAGVNCMNTSHAMQSIVSVGPSGRVFVHSNTTGTVCGNMWDDVDANVVCRQMGFSSGTAIHLPRDYTYNRLLYNVNCFGHEFQLQSCQGEDYDMSGMCGYADDAGVSCSNMTSVQSSVTLGPGGRVLAHTSNGTGTVCSDQWDDMDADVVCRQMGYPSGTASFHPRDYMYNHVIFNVRCQGNESHVEQCPVDHSDMFGNCAYHGDAGVNCMNTSHAMQSIVSVGPSGRVFVHSNTTGTVCGNMWDDVDANVVCRQMGFSSGTAIHLPRDYTYNRLLYNVNCFGHEFQLQSCQGEDYDMSGMCGYADDAGVSCSNMTSVQSSVTLGPGGRVLAHTSNGTGTVCSDQWDDMDADVVCRQMGYPSGTASFHPRDYMYNHVIFNVRCQGNESHVEQCPVDHSDMFGNCAYHGDAGVNCMNTSHAMQSIVSVGPSGRVFVHSNTTGTVCGNMWDDVDANVVCRQMGFSSGTAIHLPRDYTYNRLLYNVNCFGHEFQLQSCQGEDYDMSGMCGYADDAGVSCSNMTSVQSSVTLGPGGRVLAHTSNGTGTVCSDQWDDMDADVVCRQMGYPSGTASFHPRDYMYNHVIFNVRCQGNESHVEQCPVDHSDMFGNCAYHGDAGVNCMNTSHAMQSIVSVGPSGRVFVHSNTTGTVCGNMWDDVDANVVCRQMGFSSGTAIHLPRDYTYNRLLYNVNCFGHEFQLQSCQGEDYDMSGMCGYADDAGVSCSNMTSVQSSVTLGPGGRVLAHTSNGTGTVCSDQWDDMDADVVCRQMGYPSGTASFHPRDYMYNHVIFNVRCQGNESHVEQCPVDHSDMFGNCAYHGDAGVNCMNTSHAMQSIVSVGPSGRVFVHSNTTGTVCGNMWDDVDANVVCRQMGFSSGTAIHLPRDYTYNRLLYNVNCFGHESQLQSCQGEDYDMSGMCGYADDAGVSCSNMTSVQSSVTLGPGGRVLAHTSNGTGTVCSDQWDDMDADVVCRQMGYPSGTASFHPRDYMYNHVIFNVRCQGNESHVEQCPVDHSDMFGNCAYHGDAGVNCMNTSHAMQSIVSVGPSGRVFVHSNTTGTVCGNMWDDVDANVVCRQMGFSSGTAIHLPRDYTYNRLLYNVNCFGHESQLQSCQGEDYDMSGMCGYADDAGVSCSNMTSVQSSVTLGPGGRVLAHTSNGTGTVCSDQWDDMDADVVCRQMGYPSGTASFHPRDYMYNHVIFNVRCQGNESHVEQCPVDHSDMFGNCAYHGDAGVNCMNTSHAMQSIVSVGPSGRVFVHSNTTGTVCGNMWDDVDANVVCRQMGFSSGTAIHLPRDYTYNRLLYNVNCFGHESQLQSCQGEDYDMSGMCGYADDAGVSCSNMTSVQSSVTLGPGGRVLAHTSNGTGTVCSDQWDDMDADVVCRQMGYPSGTASFHPRDYMYNHVIFNVRCQGNESHVEQCPVDHSDMFGNCAYHGDAGVNCMNTSHAMQSIVSVGPSGRVFVHSNTTGTVCGNMWDDVDANVVCRQMGFSSGTAIHLPRDYTYNRLLYNVNCFGHESQLQSCQGEDYDMSGMCGYADDAGVSCSNMTSVQSSVTLGPGGRVLAHTSNGTGTVCSDQWDDMDADVVCRQMGYPSGTASFHPRDYMYNHVIFNVRCQGNESHVEQCPVDHSDMFGNCAYHGDAGVNCMNTSHAMQSIVSVGPSGRVFVHSNTTGTVCGNMWDDVDANVVCRQMGFSSGTAIHLPRDYTYNRLLYNVNCFGHESQLQSCQGEDYDMSGMCGYADDAGVSCSNMTSVQSSVTLGPGGRVLAHTSNGTGTVCSDQWDDMDADVVCRQMGYPSGTASFHPRDYMYNHVIFNVRCQGNESHVEQCPVDHSDMFGNCAYHGDAGVNCMNTSHAMQSIVSVGPSGRVFVHSNTTGTVCGNMWDDVDANVVCRQMGFSSGTAIHLPRDYTHNRLLYNVNCFGHESQLQSCQGEDYDMSGMCGYADDAGVSCSNMTSVQSSVTLGPGGRVLAHTSNGTGTVCSDQWDDMDADVVCRQMGYPSGTASFHPRDYMYNHVIFNVRCQGNESHVEQCPVDHSDMFGNCAYHGDAGVNCMNTSHAMQSIVSVGPSGRVFVHSNTTGTVCGNMWDDVDANVVCRQMGFSSGTAIHLPRDYTYNRLLYNVNCFGHESQLQSCQGEDYDMSGMCGYADDAGVSCSNMTSVQSSVTLGPGGRVLAHTSNGTGTVCSDQWDDMDADVVCRQMGYPSGTASFHPRDYMYNHVIFNVRCQGNESHVEQCPVDHSDMFGNCAYHGDAGVNCMNTSHAMQSIVSVGPSGRVFVHSNTTGTVCGNMWDDVDANVVCRQMGFSSGTAIHLPRDYTYNRLLYNVNCFGHESQLQSCQGEDYDMSGMCGYADDAGVSCSNMTSVQSSVTLGPGGRVLAHTSNGTGTVCSDQWDDMDADVVCRQMGYPSGTASFHPRDYMYNHVIFNVRCQGNESHVEQCPVDHSDMFGNCAYHGDAGVNCMNTSHAMQSIVSVGPSGRVFVHSNTTGTVCGNMWDDVDANVVCRQMGFSSGTAIHLPRDYTHNRLLYNVNCFGHESQLQSCQGEDYDMSGMCGYADDAGVSCSNMTSVQSSVTLGPGGRVLAHTSNGTGTVCSDQWDDMDADVVCRQMGYPSGTASFHPRDYMYNHVIFNVRCQGNESHVEQCPVDHSDMFGNCAYHGDAGVNCMNTSHAMQSIVSVGPSGRVFVHSNTTGTVCGNMWDDVDANVVCRQMGFSSGTAIHLPRDYTYNRLLYNVNCFGHESQLQSCQGEDYDMSGMCGYADDAGVSCSNMTSVQSSVTLGPGGRVLAHTSNGTGTVCSDQWDDMDADVVCRQMGYPSGTASFHPRDYMYNHVIFNVRCQGNESHVEQCPVDHSDMFGNCAYHGDAGVNCMNTSHAMQSIVSVGPSGRVFVHSNTTGTVCGNMWDDVDANVVCRQMGFSSGTAIHLPRDYTYNRLLYNVNCFGHESQLQSCQGEDYDMSGMCGYADDAGVSCSNMTSVQSSVTLGPGGRVLAHTSNGTGTVCSDQWDDMDADVVCRQMGYPSGTASFHPRDYMYNHVIFNVRCQGNESHVEQCPVDHSDMFGNCAYHGDAGVNCMNTSHAMQSIVSVGPSGRVFVHSNTTGTVCGNMWDDVDANVVCRQMGFSSGTAIHLPRDYTYNRLLYNVNCFGHESQLQSCQGEDYDMSGMCGYADDAGVSCSNMTSVQSSVTLGPGGRVLAHTSNGTGTVCSDQWDDMDADVVCRQMGYPSGTASFHPRDYMYNHVIFNVRCQGNESHVEQCPVDHSDMFGNCAYHGDAGVNCMNTSHAMQSIVSVGPSGRVFVHSNTTGTVCGNMWDDVDANVVCRQMGFSSGTAIHLPRDYTYNRLLYNVNCFGHESQLQSCQGEDYDMSGMCGYADDAGVSCSNMTSVQSSVTLGPGGRVLAHTSNGTGTVCSDQWDDMDADVVCRQMGYPSGTASFHPRDYMYNHVIFNVRCQGNESHVEQCPVDHSDMFGNCAYHGDAGVNCMNTSHAMQSIVSVGPSGRVFVHSNTTGTVCGNMWDDVDANVVCRQMGFSSGTAIHLPRDYTYNRLLYNVNCFGHESQLQSCQGEDYDMSGMCGYADDAGVSCSNMTSVQSSVTLGPGGRVLAHTSNGTGTVCSDQWDDMDADVVCRQMGYPSGTASFHPRDYMYNHVIFNVRCQGNESHVEQCPVDHSDMFGNCAYHGDAGVNCMNTSHAMQSIVSVGPSGRVFVHSNTTGTVCGNMWDDVDANVVCRQMGFSSGTAIHLPRDYTYNRLLYNVNCFGHESQLQSCQGEDYDMSGMCGYADDAGVSCSNMTSVQSSVTLGPGGRVLAHTSNGTGTVCSDQWDDMDADVVCRQMGYPSGTASFHPRDYMYNHVIFNVRCQGNESHVEQCPVDHSDMFGNCAYHGDAGVNCMNTTQG